MSAATPTRVSATSPVQWLRSFAYTPSPARAINRTNDYRNLEFAVDHCVCPSDADALPTLSHSRRAVRNPSRGTVRDCDTSEGGASPSMVPRKRRRSSVCRELALGVSSASISPNPGPSTTWHTRTRRPRTRYTSPSRPDGSACGYHDGQGPARSHATRTRSRVVLDAVEIVSKKRPLRDRMADSRTRPAESAREEASSHYPSPPVSRAPRCVELHNNQPSADISHPHTVARDDRAGPETALPLKPSKYFAHVAGQRRSVPETIPVLTPPSSPVLTIPVYIESSDFEYPLLDGSFDEPLESTIDESRHIPRIWYNNPSLFDDLMIVLRRLKPILVQGRWYCCIATEP